jgi:hypothetical protein
MTYLQNCIDESRLYFLKQQKDIQTHDLDKAALKEDLPLLMSLGQGDNSSLGLQSNVWTRPLPKSRPDFN